MTCRGFALTVARTVVVFGVLLAPAHSQVPPADRIKPESVGGTAGSPPAAGPPSSLTLSGGAAGRTAVSGEGTEKPATGPRAAAVAGAPERRAGSPSAAPALPQGLAVLTAFECPREAIGRLLENAKAPGETSASLSLEREVLELCRDRQGILTEIVDFEMKLAEVLRGEASARAAEALKRETARQLAEERVAAMREQLARAADEARAALQAAEEPEPVVVEQAPELPDYSWFSMLGGGGSLRAGVSDGEQVWFVEPGDELPGGVFIETISANPAGVEVRGAIDGSLPYRRPAEGR